MQKLLITSKEDTKKNTWTEESKTEVKLYTTTYSTHSASAFLAIYGPDCMLCYFIFDGPTDL